MTDNTRREKMILLRKEMDAAKEVMVDNVEKLVHRAELVEGLEEKTRDMRNQSQGFPLEANDLKIKLRTRHSAISGAIIFGILGVAYGLINGKTKEGAAIGAIIAGVPASMLGGLAGHKLGQVSGVLERLWFRAVYAYNHFRPIQTLKEKVYAWYYKDKMQFSVNNAQEMLAKYKKDETKLDENVEKNQLDNSASVPAALNHPQTQIVAHGFEAKKRQQKEEMESKKVPGVRLRTKM